MVDVAPFERYHPLIDDWTAFVEALQRPLPTCVRTNTLRAAPDQIGAWLQEEALPVQPLPWMRHVFKLPPGVSPGNQLPYVAGLYHVQEEASLMPVPLLDPQPGERVLDLCAAPGGKTAQIAARMQNRGTVVANDVSFGRLSSLRSSLDRLGALNVTTTQHDGASYPAESGSFDRVLADVPCSCEGTSRKNPGVIERRAAVRDMTGLQTALLRKAVQRCRPGGRIVYSTCTYAPEENEQVVDTVLREYSDDVRLRPARLEGVTVSPGITEWNGQALHPSLSNTMRVWPHQNDTGGFFVAVLEKEETDTLPITDVVPVVDPEPYWTLLKERFGIPRSTFDEYVLVKPGRKKVYIVSEEHLPPARPEADTIGMPFMRVKMAVPKLTTAAAMQFGGAAVRNLITATPEQAEAYLTRRDFQATEQQIDRCTGRGYVLVRYQGWPLGIGFLQGLEGGLVRSMFPKGFARDAEAFSLTG